MLTFLFPSLSSSPHLIFASSIVFFLIFLHLVLCSDFLILCLNVQLFFFYFSLCSLSLCSFVFLYKLIQTSLHVTNFVFWLSHLSWFPETAWKHMLRTSRYSLITHICRTPKSKTAVAFGRGALHTHSTKLIQNTHHPVRASWGGNTQGLWVNAHCCMEQGSISSSLWPRSVWNDRAVCCSAAFLCITRTNEDLITPVWALFVCFCAPVLSCLHMVLLSLGLFCCTYTHTNAHMQSTHNSQTSEIPLCTV